MDLKKVPIIIFAGFGFLFAFILLSLYVFNLGPTDVDKPEATNYFGGISPSPLGICGVKMDTPKADTEVVFPIIIAGYVGDCGWDVEGGYAGSFQIIDESGRTITGEIALKVVSAGFGKYNFSFAVTPQLLPSGDEGYILFKDADLEKSNEEDREFILPIKFKQ
jgi:hypothetical protein